MQTQHRRANGITTRTTDDTSKDGRAGTQANTFRPNRQNNQILLTNYAKSSKCFCSFQHFKTFKKPANHQQTIQSIFVTCHTTTPFSTMFWDSSEESTNAAAGSNNNINTVVVSDPVKIEHDFLIYLLCTIP